MKRIAKISLLVVAIFCAAITTLAVIYDEPEISRKMSLSARLSDGVGCFIGYFLFISIPLLTCLGIVALIKFAIDKIMKKKIS